MNSKRAWIFRLLVLIGAAGFLASWFSVWWRADITMLGDNWTQIRPYALEMDPFIKGYLPAAKMPDWMPPFVWTYFGAVLLVLAIGLFAPAKLLGFWKIKFSLPTWLVTGAGVSFIVCAVTMAIYASIEMQGDRYMGMKLIGDQYLLVDPDSGSYSAVYAYFKPGYFLAYVTGLYLVIVGLLSDKIKGVKPV